MGQSKSKHILLVEDYDPVRELIANMLEDRSYRVSTVPAGASMRDFLRADDRVDLWEQRRDKLRRRAWASAPSQTV